jgi:hypothetical protein
MTYIVASKVRALTKENDRRCGAGFLKALDARVREMVITACRVHNGGKKTLDYSVAEFSGCAPKGDQ